MIDDEDLDGDEEEAPAPRAPSRLSTPEGIRALNEELDRLWREERPKVTREVSDAAAQGDRSENAEYIYGKKRLREIDRRIQFLRRTLDKLQIVHPRERSDGRVAFGAWVRLEDDEGVEVEYRLVGAHEIDARAGRISVDSPVGRALLGKQEGDDISVRLPRGSVSYTVLAVRFRQ